MAQPPQPLATGAPAPGLPEPLRLAVVNGLAPREAADDPEDAVLLRVRQHWAGLAGRLLAPAAVGLASAAALELRLVLPALAALGVAVAVGWAVAAAAGWASASLALTPSDLLLERDLLPRVSSVIPLETIHEVTCRQSLVGRALGFGMLELELIGGPPRHFSPVAHPRRLRSCILHCRRRASGGHGVH